MTNVIDINDENEDIEQSEEIDMVYEAIGPTRNKVLSDFVFKESNSIKEAMAVLKINYQSTRSLMCKVRFDGFTSIGKRGWNNIRKIEYSKVLFIITKNSFFHA